jgi:uncharacterized protein (TIGR02118 family)
MDRRTLLGLGIASAAVMQSDASARSQDAATQTPVKLIVIYDQPDDDTAAFFRHYATVHAPLVKKTPGLQSFVLNRVTEELVGGEPPCILIAEMTFADRASFDAAMRSPENQAAGQDLMTFAKGKVRILVADSAPA